MTVADDRVQRHRAIRTVVRDQPIGSQDDLARALSRQGHPVTQATLSRDLRELRILRVPTEDGYRYAEAGASAPQAARRDGVAPSEARRMKSVAALEVTGIDSNEACVVVRTLVGRAQGVAVWIDELALKDALATIAGDDTILVVPRSVRRTARLRAALAEALGGGRDEAGDHPWPRSGAKRNSNK